MALRWVLFDLNGTLVDTAVMAQPLGDTAADEDLVSAAVDDAIQLAMVVTLTGREAEFSELVRAGLRRRLRLAGRDPSAADDALGLMGAMPAFIDAPAALEQLRGIGLRLGVLTQSTEAAADAVLRFAGLRDRIEIVISAPESGAFKPDPRPYRLALERVGGHGGRGRARRRALVGRGRRQGGRAAHGLGRAPRPRAARRRCRSPTSAAATCSRSRRDWPRSPRRGRERGISRRAGGGGSCAG